MKTIGVIGLGSIGMRHAKNLVAMGHRVWGYDPTMPAIPNVITCSTPHAVVENSDAVVIASPTHQHWFDLDLVTGAKKHVFVEKPIGTTHNMASGRCFEIAQENNLVVMVGNNLRFHESVQLAKQWLAEGRIGKLLWATFHVGQLNTKYKEPVVLNWGAHEIDLALYLLGPATVTAAAGDDQIMDVCMLHEYGVRSTIHMDYVTPNRIRTFQIIGTEGIMLVDLETRHICRLGGDEKVASDGLKYTMDAFKGTSSFNQDYKDEMQAFIDLIDGKSVPHAATGQDGLNALELILEAQRRAQ